MKKLISTLITLAFSLALISPVSAGLNGEEKAGKGEGRRGGGPAERLERLKEKLSLTDEQVDKVRPILEKDREKLMALRKDDTIKPEERREKVRAIIQAQFEEIKAILTPEQQEKVKELLEKRRENAGKEAGKQ